MRKLFGFLVACLAVIPFMSHTAQAATLENARWVTRNDAPIPYVRMVMDLTAPIKAKAGISQDGKTTTVTLQNTKIGEGVNKSMVMDKTIATKANLVEKNNNVDVVISTPSSMDVKDVKVFSLKKDTVKKKPYRIVIDLQKKGVAPKTNYYGKNSTSSSSNGPTNVAIPTTAKATPATTPSYSTSGGLKGKTIAIDPGHGGSDPGAIGANGTQEKNVTLPISKYLKSDLEAMGAKVVMTRTTDVDVYAPNASGVDELQARVNVANYNNADALVSVHINAFDNRNVGGIATYYYTQGSYGAKLADKVQAQIANTPGFNGDRGTQPGNLYVLRHSSMPAILVELGFISNPSEENAMVQPSTQQDLAQRIANGIAAYFGA